MILQNVNTQLATIHNWLKFLFVHAITHHQERMQQSRVLYVQWVSISTLIFVFQANLFDTCFSCVCTGVILMLLTVDAYYAFG